jgi:hypothetical protein
MKRIRTQRPKAQRNAPRVRSLRPTRETEVLRQGARPLHPSHQEVTNRCWCLPGAASPGAEQQRLARGRARRPRAR